MICTRKATFLHQIRQQLTEEVEMETETLSSINVDRLSCAVYDNTYALRKSNMA